MKKIFFRADASDNIGYGHFTRTLALADMLKGRFECVFFTQSPTDYQKNELSKICRFVELPSSYEKFKKFIDYITGDEIVVLDNYFYTTEYQNQIKKLGCKLVCIDDMHDKHYVADIVINHGIDDPTVFDIESYTKLCLGFDWALLRKPFRDAIYDTRHKKLDRINSVLITFGGTDELDITSMTIERILKVRSDIVITAIVGDGYSGKIIQSSNVRYQKNISAYNMAKAMIDADVVICSASTVCIEAIACNAKLIINQNVDNQKDIFNMCVKSNVASPLRQLEQILTGEACIETSGKVISPDIKNRYINIFNTL